MKKENCETPCLCDTCLKARDAEIARVRKFKKQEIVEEILDIVVENKVAIMAGKYDFLMDLLTRFNQPLTP